MHLEWIALELLSIHSNLHMYRSTESENENLHPIPISIQGEKRQPYDEDIRVPLIVRGPSVPSNMKTDALALNIDLVRTTPFRTRVLFLGSARRLFCCNLSTFTGIWCDISV